MRAKGLCNPSPLQNLHQLGLIDIVAHRSHLYQRLVIAGWSHRAVTLLYLGLAVLGAVLAVLWTVAAPGSDFAVAVLPTVCAFLLWRGVVRVEARASPQG